MTDPNPIYTLQQIAGGICLPRCLHVVADLGVADVLDESPRTAAELAAPVGAHPDALGRVLRLLSAHGVFESQGDKFCHSPASRLLRADHPQSMRAFARMLGELRRQQLEQESWREEAFDTAHRVLTALEDEITRSEK